MKKKVKNNNKLEIIIYTNSGCNYCKIVIYTNEQCAYCKQIKEELNKSNINFEEKLTKDYLETWQNINSLTGMTIVPTVYYKNNYFVPVRDFQSPQHLISILNNFEESKFAIEKQAYEKLKTLNYNIMTAFQRTDQLLKQIESKLNIEENEHESTS